jgi:predicted permease
MLDGIRSRLRSIVRRDTVANEMEEELREHLEQATALYIRRGMKPDEARLAARRELGHVGTLVEEAGDAWGARSLDDLRRDVRQALRSLARTPGFTLVVILTLAFGFGVNGALFSFMRGALRASPVLEPSTWVSIPSLWSWTDYRYFRDSIRSIEHLAAHSEQRVLVRIGGDEVAEEVPAMFASEGYFTGLRARPLLGRLFGADEVAPPAGEPVVILSHRFWMRRLGGDSSVVGRGLRLGGGQTFTIVGVMPRQFAGGSFRVPDLWLPLGARARLPGFGNQLNRGSDDSWFGEGGREYLWLGGRMAPGATIDAVRSELALRIAQRSAPDDSLRAGSVSARIRTEDEALSLGGDGTVVAGLVLATGISVLLIASVTVANLMLARAAARRREMGVRVALGASRGRVIRAWLTECLVVGGAAAALGMAIGVGTVRGVLLSAPLRSVSPDMDMDLYVARIAPDLAVVGYLAVLAVFSALTFGLAPVLRATRDDPLTTIRESNAARQMRGERIGWRNALVVSQVALTMVLLIGSGMLLRGLLAAGAVDPGFDRHDVLVVRPSLRLSGYDTTRARLFIDDLLSRAMSISGVQSVTRGNVPMLNFAPAAVAPVAGDPAGSNSGGQFNAVSETYFGTLGIPIERGRAFTAEEVRREASVVILSATTARTLFPGEEALGKLVSVRPRVRGTPEGSRDGSRPTEGRFESARVIGIAADVQSMTLGIVPARYAYVPGDYWDLMIRRDPRAATAVEERLQALAREIDPDVALWTRSLEQVIWNSSGFLAIARTMTIVGAGVGGLSLVLAMIGLFGLTAYAVEQRTREFGVRMALGARSLDIVRLVSGQSLRLVAIGAVIGLAGAAAGGGVLRRTLHGVSAVDPLAYAAVATILAVVAFLACGIPARRATRVDPMTSLRAD